MSKKVVLTILLLNLLLISLVGCMGKKNSNGQGRRQVSKTFQGNVGRNGPESVPVGYGRALHDNPRILANDLTINDQFDLALLLDSAPDFITYNANLENSCGPTLSGLTFTRNQCYKVLQESTSLPLLPINGKWAFDPLTAEFVEVHTFYHVNKIVTTFQNYLGEAYQVANPLGIISNGGGSYMSSISSKLYSTSSYWNETELAVYSKCELGDPAVDWAHYDPINNYLCLPKHPDFFNFYAAQDPTVIYHEMQHAFAQILINQRNKSGGLTTTLSRVLLGYAAPSDEGSALGEGLSDFFSYLMNDRTHLGEWGIGLLGVSRPMSETDYLHIPGISRDDDGRLSYPLYLNYDPNYSQAPIEDHHYAGMILTHFLVSLTEEIIGTCDLPKDYAKRVIYSVIIEALGELGDVTSKGSDLQTSSEDRVNLSPILDSSGAYLSQLWSRSITPINYRRFFQYFSKYFLYQMSMSTFQSYCQTNLATYDQDKLEKLLDKYGLLLFKTYNTNGSGAVSGHSGTNVKVASANRKRSVLISKDYLQLTSEPSTMYIFDIQENISKIVAGLKSRGSVTTTSPLIPGNLDYNNGNGRISPGEIVGIIPILENKSNSEMGGVQSLANDWDHGKLVEWTPVATAGSGDPKALYTGDLKPCNNFADGFPLASEGAAPLMTPTPSISATPTPMPGDCEYITRLNGSHKSCSLTQTNSSAADYCSYTSNEMSRDRGAQELLMPVCLVLFHGTNETRWVSQKAYRQSLGISQSKCLLSDSPYDCFVRFIPGADSAYYSKIAPHSTWAKTVASEGTSPTFNSSNFLLMEVNPRVPPGTTFDCRLRARFTNCNDCWHDLDLSDQDDYLDYEYSGGKPFKIFHLQFTVTD